MLCIGKKRGKKAQITVFLIVGLVILLASGIFFYLKEIGIGDYKILQPKSAPVEKYIETCMQKVGREALDLAGTQGGFTEFPPEIKYDPSRSVYVVPPLAGTASFAPKVPLWWHNGVLKQPSIIFTESEVDRYIEQNIRQCLRNFDAFRNEFNFVEYTNISSYTRFADKDVSLTLNYELDIIHKGSGKVTRRNKFVTKLPVKFKAMQEAAQEISQAAVDQLFFEDVAFNLMAAIPEEAPDGLPFTGMMFSCGTITWNMFKIKSRFQDALRIVMTGVRFDDTDHLPFKGDEDEYEPFRDAFQRMETIDQNELDNMETQEIFMKYLGHKRPPSDAYEYFQLFFDFTDDKKTYKDFKIAAEYRPDFGMNFVANPSSNGVMKSTSTDFRHKLMSLLCMNYYHFVYNVRFPVIITIKDPDAYDGDGAVFKFAHMASIVNNEPDKRPRPAEYFEPQEVAPDFCDPVNRNGQKVEIIAVDSNTAVEIPRVNLSYKCFRSYCYLGETETNNMHFQLTANLPQGCSRGILTAEKDGYLTKDVQILETPTYVEMDPVINMTYQVKKRRSQNQGPIYFLAPNEHVAIDIQSNDPAYSYFTDYTEDDRFNMTHSIELLKKDDVTYHMNLYLFKTVGDQDILTGGWIGNWTPDLSDLKDLDKLTLQVVEQFPSPTSFDKNSMVQAYELISNRSNYKDVKPETYALQSTRENETNELP